MMNRPKYTPVRFSHLTSYAGIGAIVRGVEDRLMVLVDTRYWRDENGSHSTTIIPYVRRITKVLDIDKELHMPPVAKEDPHQGISGAYLPAVLFPRFAVCKKCGLLHNQPWSKQNKKFDEVIRCASNNCDGVLEQVTWCAVSSKGHLSEVPWHYICHQDSFNKCEQDYNNEYLELSKDKDGKRIVYCRRCGCSNSFERNKGLKFIDVEQPWMPYRKPILEKEDTVEILEVNNPGVYLPTRVNAIVIPPESRISKSTLVDKLYRNSKICRDIDSIRQKLRKKSKIREVARKFLTSSEEVEKALKEIKNGYPYIDDIYVNDLYEDEYKAFLKPLEDQKEDEDFVTEHVTDKWKGLASSSFSDELNAIISSVDRLISVRRIREIQVFKGFRRISSEKDTELVPPDITGESNWLPAIELFGEGIFFSLNESMLQRWESNLGLVKRTEEIKQRYEKAQLDLNQDVDVTSRFILLHTMAHLLIRELEGAAGYPAASLKERIYSSRAKEMAGILIYTTVSDIAGSLGGIINSAEPKTFLSIMDNVFKKSQWCSLDPVCTEHQGQGPGWLNRAACHACALIPEPSCEFGNVFLDRVYIKGNREKGIPGFLDFISNDNGE